MTLEGAKFICLDEGGNHGEILLAKGRKFTMGYYVSCDFILVDERAKGVHCEIECDAFGRVTIRNFASDKPIYVNGSSVEIKRILLNNSKLSILDKEYLWIFPKSSSIEFEDLPVDTTSTPLKQICIAEQPPNSCPDFKLHRDLPKRFTVHNFAYCIQSGEEINISSESNDEKNDNIDEGSTEAKDSNKNVSPTKDINEINGTPEPKKVLAELTTELFETPTINVINRSQDKENKSAENKNNQLLKMCYQSDMVITSFTPRETGVKIAKSFASIIKPKLLISKSPKSVYSTPKTDMTINDDEGNGHELELIQFYTPSTSKKGMESVAMCTINSSMHLIDLTTPTKLRPGSPYLKSALKASANKNITHVADKSSIKLSAKERQLGVSVLPVTPAITEVDSNSLKTPSSVISVSSCTDISSVIEVTSDGSNMATSSTSATGLSTPLKAQTRPEACTPKRTPHPLMKRALLTSARKQNTALPTNTQNVTALCKEPINRKTIRSNLPSLGKPITPRTSTVNISSSELLKRRSMSTPCRKSMSARTRVENMSSPSNFPSGSDSVAVSTSPGKDSRRFSLNPICAARALPTSTPIADSRKKSTFNTRTVCKTSPLHKVRKYLGSVSLSSNIPKGRKSIIQAASTSKINSIKKKSPQQVMSDRLLTRARKSLSGSPIPYMLSRMAGSEKLSAQKPCCSNTLKDKTMQSAKKLEFETNNQAIDDNEIDNLSRTFVISSDEEVDVDSKKRQETRKDATFSPQKDVNATEKKQPTIEIPVDVQEVVDITKGNKEYECEAKNLRSSEEKKVSAIESENEMDNKKENNIISNNDKTKPILTEESFAEVIQDTEKGNNCGITIKIVDNSKNASDFETPESFSATADKVTDKESRKDAPTDVVKVTNEINTEENNVVESGFGEESITGISQNANKDNIDWRQIEKVYEKPKIQESVALNSHCKQKNTQENETIAMKIAEEESKCPDTQELKLKDDEYKPIVEDITVEDSLIEKQTKENDEIIASNQLLCEHSTLRVESFLIKEKVKSEEIKEENIEKIMKASVDKEQISGSTKVCDIYEPSTKLQSANVEQKTNIQLTKDGRTSYQTEQVIASDCNRNKPEMLESESNKIYKNVNVENENYEITEQHQTSDTNNVYVDIVDENVKQTNNVNERKAIDSKQTEIFEGNEKSLVHDTVHEAAKIPEEVSEFQVSESVTALGTVGGLEETNKLLEEIEDVLNKSDEIKQKHLNELEQCCDKPLTEEFESEKSSQENAESSDSESSAQIIELPKAEDKYVVDILKEDTTEATEIEKNVIGDCESSAVVTHEDTEEVNLTPTKNILDDINTNKKKIENTTRFTPRRSTRRPSQCSDKSEHLVNLTLTPRRSARRASLSAESTATLTPTSRITRRSSLSSVSAAPLTPKPITNRRLSISIDDESSKPSPRLQEAKTPRKQFQQSMVIPEEVDEGTDDILNDLKLQKIKAKIQFDEKIHVTPISRNDAAHKLSAIQTPRSTSTRKEKSVIIPEEMEDDVVDILSDDNEPETKQFSRNTLRCEKNLEQDCERDLLVKATEPVELVEITSSTSVIDSKPNKVNTEQISITQITNEKIISKNEEKYEMDIKGAEDKEIVAVITLENADTRRSVIPKDEESINADNIDIEAPKDISNVIEDTEQRHINDNSETLGAKKPKELEDPAEQCEIDKLLPKEETSKTALEHRIISCGKSNDYKDNEELCSSNTKIVAGNPDPEENVVGIPAKTCNSPETALASDKCIILKTPKYVVNIAQENHIKESAAVTALVEITEAGTSEMSTPKSKKYVTMVPNSTKTPLMAGVRELLKTPKVEMATPKFSGIRNLLQTPKPNLENEQEETENLAMVAELVQTPKSSKYNQHSIDELPSTSMKRNNLKGVKELLRTPKSCATPRFRGIRELMQTPKVISSPITYGVKELLDTPDLQSSHDAQSSEEISSTTITSLMNLKGEKELQKTPKSCSTPHFKAVKELMQTPNTNSTPALVDIKEVMETPAQNVDHELEKFLRTPTAKNIMILSIPSSTVIEKNSDSIEVSTEYDLNCTHEGTNLEDLFKTSATTHFVERITESYYGEDVTEQAENAENLNRTKNLSLKDVLNENAELAFDKLIGQDTQIHTPISRRYTRKSLPLQTAQQQSPFTTADVFSDLPKTDVEEWIEALDEAEPPIILECENSEGEDIQHDILNESAVNVQENKTSVSFNESIIPETSTKMYFKESTLSNKSTDSLICTETKDPLSNTGKQLYEQKSRSLVTPIDAEISGINLLDQTVESLHDQTLTIEEPLVVEARSMLEERLLVSDNESETENRLNSPHAPEVSQDEDNDLSEPLVVSDSEDLNQTPEAGRNVLMENAFEITETINEVLHTSNTEINVEEKSILEKVPHLAPLIAEDPLDPENTEISTGINVEYKTLLELADSQSETEYEEEESVKDNNNISLKEEYTLAFTDCPRHQNEQIALSAKIEQEVSKVLETSSTCHSDHTENESNKGEKSSLIIEFIDAEIDVDETDETNQEEACENVENQQVALKDANAITIEQTKTITIETEDVLFVDSAVNEICEETNISNSEQVKDKEKNVLTKEEINEERQDIIKDNSNIDETFAEENEVSMSAMLTKASIDNTPTVDVTISVEGDNNGIVSSKEENSSSNEVVEYIEENYVPFNEEVVEIKSDNEGIVESCQEKFPEEDKKEHSVLKQIDKDKNAIEAVHEYTDYQTQTVSQEITPSIEELSIQMDTPLQDTSVIELNSLEQIPVETKPVENSETDNFEQKEIAESVNDQEIEAQPSKTTDVQIEPPDRTTKPVKETTQDSVDNLEQIPVEIKSVEISETDNFQEKEIEESANDKAIEAQPSKTIDVQIEPPDRTTKPVKETTQDSVDNLKQIPVETKSVETSNFKENVLKEPVNDKELEGQSSKTTDVQVEHSDRTNKPRKEATQDNVENMNVSSIFEEKTITAKQESSKKPVEIPYHSSTKNYSLNTDAKTHLSLKKTEDVENGTPKISKQENLIEINKEVISLKEEFFSSSKVCQISEVPTKELNRNETAEMPIHTQKETPKSTSKEIILLDATAKAITPSSEIIKYDFAIQIRDTIEAKGIDPLTSLQSSESNNPTSREEDICDAFIELESTNVLKSSLIKTANAQQNEETDSAEKSLDLKAQNREESRNHQGVTKASTVKSETEVSTININKISEISQDSTQEDEISTSSRRDCRKIIRKPIAGKIEEFAEEIQDNALPIKAKVSATVKENEKPEKKRTTSESSQGSGKDDDNTYSRTRRGNRRKVQKTPVKATVLLEENMYEDSTQISMTGEILDISIEPDISIETITQTKQNLSMSEKTQKTNIMKSRHEGKKQKLGEEKLFVQQTEENAGNIVAESEQIIADSGEQQNLSTKDEDAQYQKSTIPKSTVSEADKAECVGHIISIEETSLLDTKEKSDALNSATQAAIAESIHYLTSKEELTNVLKDSLTQEPTVSEKVIKVVETERQDVSTVSKERTLTVLEANQKSDGNEEKTKQPDEQHEGVKPANEKVEEVPKIVNHDSIPQDAKTMVKMTRRKMQKTPVVEESSSGAATAIKIDEPNIQSEKKYINIDQLETKEDQLVELEVQQRIEKRVRRKQTLSESSQGSGHEDDSLRTRSSRSKVQKSPIKEIVIEEGKNELLLDRIEEIDEVEQKITKEAGNISHVNSVNKLKTDADLKVEANEPLLSVKCELSSQSKESTTTDYQIQDISKDQVKSEKPKEITVKRGRSKRTAQDVVAEEPTTSRKSRRKLETAKADIINADAKAKPEIFIIQKHVEKLSTPITASEKHAAPKIDKVICEELPALKTKVADKIASESESDYTKTSYQEKDKVLELTEACAEKQTDKLQFTKETLQEGQQRKIQLKDRKERDEPLKEKVTTTPLYMTRRAGRHNTDSSEITKNTIVPKTRNTKRNRKVVEPEHSTDLHEQQKLSEVIAENLEIPKGDRMIVNEPAVPLEGKEVIEDKKNKITKETELSGNIVQKGETSFDKKYLKRSNTHSVVSEVVDVNPTKKRVRNHITKPKESQKEDIELKDRNIMQTQTELNEDISSEKKEVEIEKEVLEKPQKFSKRRAADKHDKDPEELSIKPSRKRGAGHDSEIHNCDRMTEEAKMPAKDTILSDVKITESSLQSKEPLNTEEENQEVAIRKSRRKPDDHQETLSVSKRRAVVAKHIEEDRIESTPSVKKRVGRKKKVEENHEDDMHHSVTGTNADKTTNHSSDKQKQENEKVDQQYLKNAEADLLRQLNTETTTETIENNQTEKDSNHTENIEITSRRRNIGRKKAALKQDQNKQMTEKNEDCEEEANIEYNNDINKPNENKLEDGGENRQPQEGNKKVRTRNKIREHQEEIEQPSLLTSSEKKDKDVNKERIQTEEKLTQKQEANVNLPNDTIEHQTPTHHRTTYVAASKGRKVFEHITAESEETVEDTPTRRARNVPQRRAATAYHNYDETSDSEVLMKTKKKTDSPRKSLEAVKKSTLATITTAPVVSISPSPSSLAVITTARGRTRKPTAKVQQFLEEERAKAETPKKRALLAAAAGIAAATAQRSTPAKRGRKPSTIEITIEGTPKTTKGRGRPKLVSAHAEERETSVVSTEPVPVAEEKQMLLQTITTPALSMKGRRGARKAKIAVEEPETSDEPPVKKSLILETEKQSSVPSAETSTPPTRTAGKRNAAAAAKARIEEDALAAAAIDPPKRARTKKATPKVSTPAAASTDAHTPQIAEAEQQQSTKVDEEAEDKSSSQKREYRLTSVSTVEGIEDLGDETEIRDKPANKKLRKAATITTTASPAVPVKRGRKPKIVEEIPDPETPAAESKTSRGRDKKNVHFDRQAEAISSQQTATEVESTRADTSEPPKRGTRTRRK